MMPERDVFKDARVRRAFSRAINRQQFVDLIYQGEAQADGLVHAPQGSYAFNDEELKKYQPYDAADAKKLVAAVGGIKVKMMYPASISAVQHDKHLPILLKQMQDVGIEIEQDPQDVTTWLENYRTLNYTLSLSLNQVYETPELPLDFHAKGGPLSDRSYAIGLNIPEIDEAITKTKETLDLEERITAVREAQKIIYSHDPAFFALVSPFNYLAFSKRVKNVPTGIGSTDRLINESWLAT